jgi:hypothetical protein
MRGLLIYSALLLCATAKIASMPEHSFDGYLYSYLVSHDLREFKSNASVPPEYVAMPDQSYAQQAPFYRVKVFFVLLVRGLARFTGVIRAPFVVSALAYFLTGMAVWFWLRAASVPEPWRSVAGLFLMFSSVTTDTARMGTPDMLCALLLVLGACLLLVTEHAVYGGVLLLLSIFTRTDCLIMASALIVLAFWQKRIGIRFAGTFLALFASGYFAISRIGYSYSRLLAFTVRTGYVRGFLHGFAKTELAIYAPFALLALIALKRGYQRELIVLCAITLVIRYVVFPHLEIRYLLPQAMIVGILGAASVLASGTTDLGKAAAGLENANRAS